MKARIGVAVCLCVLLTPLLSPSRVLARSVQRMRVCHASQLRASADWQGNQTSKVGGVTFSLRTGQRVLYSVGPFSNSESRRACWMSMRWYLRPTQALQPQQQSGQLFCDQGPAREWNSHGQIGAVSRYVRRSRSTLSCRMRAGQYRVLFGTDVCFVQAVHRFASRLVTGQRSRSASSVQ